MTYHELIALYRTGKLSEEQRARVEADIERQEAISEYLFEAEEVPGVEALIGEGAGTGENYSLQETEDMEERFVKMIRRSIRKAFVKMGICVGAVLLLAVLFIIFCLPGMKAVILFLGRIFCLHVLGNMVQ